MTEGFGLPCLEEYIIFLWKKDSSILLGRNLVIPFHWKTNIGDSAKESLVSYGQTHPSILHFNFRLENINYISYLHCQLASTLHYSNGRPRLKI